MVTYVCCFDVSYFVRVAWNYVVLQPSRSWCITGSQPIVFDKAALSVFRLSVFDYRTPKQGPNVLVSFPVNRIRIRIPKLEAQSGQFRSVSVQNHGGAFLQSHDENVYAAFREISF